MEPWLIAFVTFTALVLLHLVGSPYTKVEESFNIQAAHDILTYGIPTNNVYLRLKANYDHMTFSGAVPRTFIGALMLAGVAKPLLWLSDLDGKGQQMLVRAVLGFVNAVAMTHYAHGVRRAFGKMTALWHIAIQASQFHIFYYASRTLPNMFAFGICTYALSFLIPDQGTLHQVRHRRLALYLMTLATIIFRSELAILLGAVSLQLLLFTNDLSSSFTIIRTTLIPAILSGSIAGLILTVTIDTFLWQAPQPLWPELSAFLANVFPSAESLGASAWGTSSWHWYFTSALPRLILNPVLLLLLPYGFTTPVTLRPALNLLFPVILYTTLYSLLPHKETRFLFPILPHLTLALSLVPSYISTHLRPLMHQVMLLVLIPSLILTAIISHTILLPLSAQTYPGAHALHTLHQSIHTHQPQPRIDIHLTNLALQSGITLFLEPHPPSLQHPLFTLPGSPEGHKRHKPTISGGRTRLIYDKTSNETEFLDPQFWRQFEYVVVEDPTRAIGSWDVVGRVTSLGRPEILRPDQGRGLLAFGKGHAAVSSRNDSISVLADKADHRRTREPDGLMNLLEAMYGKRIAETYAVLHDVIREGWGIPGVSSLTGGWWLHWGLEPRLYVLKKGQGAGIYPN